MVRLSETRESRGKSIERIAEDAFKDHILKPEQEEGPVRMWLCRTPGTTDYYFRVVAARNMIMVYGDVGDNVLMPYCRDTVAWIRGACDSPSYVIQKIRTKDDKEFMPAEARALLEWEIESVKNEDDDCKDRARELVDKVNEDWEFYEDDYGSEQKFCEAWIEHGGEAECLDSAFGHTSDTLWTVMCLQKFVELYNEHYGLNE